MDVDALVGGAGGRRLSETGRGEDALRPGVHCGLEEQRQAMSEGQLVGTSEATGQKHRVVLVSWGFKIAAKAFWPRKSHIPTQDPS